MFKRILKILRRPTPVEVAVITQVETELALLRSHAMRENADAEIAAYTARIKRLRAFIASNTHE